MTAGKPVSVPGPVLAPSSGRPASIDAMGVLRWRRCGSAGRTDRPRRCRVSPTVADQGVRHRCLGGGDHEQGHEPDRGVVRVARAASVGALVAGIFALACSGQLACGQPRRAWLGATWATRMRSVTLYRVLAALPVLIAAALAWTHFGSTSELGLPAGGAFQVPWPLDPDNVSHWFSRSAGGLASATGTCMSCATQGRP